MRALPERGRAIASPKLLVAAGVRLVHPCEKNALLGFEPEYAYRIIALSSTLC